MAMFFIVKIHGYLFYFYIFNINAYGNFGVKFSIYVNEMDKT